MHTQQIRAKMHSMALLGAGLLISLSGIAGKPGSGQRELIWPKGKMPDYQEHQIAAMTYEPEGSKFKSKDHQVAYLEWFERPADEVRNGTCMILISGGSYECCCDMKYIEQWSDRLTAEGVQCVNFVYRTPRPVGMAIYQSAWEDGQRAVRMVRSEAKKRGFDPEKIGVVSMSAGSHLALLLAANSQTAAYQPVDKLDSVPCHINLAIVHAPAYVTTDGETGIPATRDGYGTDVQLSDVFHFDEKTCPMSLHHGGLDCYSPNGSTLIYRELRKRHVPAELHLYPNVGHAALGFERGVEFMQQLGFLGETSREVDVMEVYNSDSARARVIRQAVWPEGKTPDFQEHQDIPYIEWHFPKELKTKSIQIVYSGGAYDRSKPDDFEVAPVRRKLNAEGMTVVTLHYRVPRPLGLSKHTTAWQDLQRTIRLVKSQAASFGLDPNSIGLMGSSAGGHLTLMGVTSSLHQSYLPTDSIDQLPCNVQWGIGIYPAYALTDGIDQHNTTGGNSDAALLVPEFSFDLCTCPMLFVHGDADGWAAMNSLKVWEKMRSMGVQSELHTLATREHCFNHYASQGTGSASMLDRIVEFLQNQKRL